LPKQTGIEKLAIIGWHKTKSENCEFIRHYQDDIGRPKVAYIFVNKEGIVDTMYEYLTIDSWGTYELNTMELVALKQFIRETRNV